MRSLTLLVLFLGIILTAHLGFTSPVPDFIKNLKALISADKNDNNIANRDVTNSVAGLAPDAEEGSISTPWGRCNKYRRPGTVCPDIKKSDDIDNDVVNNVKRDTTGAAADLLPNREEGSTVEGWRRCRYGASCWKRSNNVDVVSYSDMNMDHHASSTSPTNLLERQLVDPMITEVNKPCFESIMSKYDHMNLTTMSDADKEALVDAIIDCRFSSSAETTASNLAFQEPSDVTATKEAAKRCAVDKIAAAYLATHFEILNDPNQLYNWLILLGCPLQEPNSPIRSPKLRARQYLTSNSEHTACILDVQEKFQGDRNDVKVVEAMIAEVDDKCGLKDKRDLNSVVLRDSADAALAAFKAEGMSL